ncbi:helix-turn-helix domain-containing protein [Streptomyces luteolifulvus]
MRSRKLSLRRLADVACVAHSTVARVLNGDVLPDIGTLTRLEDALDHQLWPGPSPIRTSVSARRQVIWPDALRGERPATVTPPPETTSAPRPPLNGQTEPPTTRSRGEHQPTLRGTAGQTLRDTPAPVLHTTAPPRSATLFTSAVRSRQMSARETVASTSAPPLTSGLVYLG